MRIDGYHSSLYPHQALSSAAPGVEQKKSAEEKRMPKEPEKVLPEPVKEEKNFFDIVRCQAQKDWELLCEGAAKLFAKSKELLKTIGHYIGLLSGAIIQIISRIGNPGIQEEKQAEGGILPLTWQQSFKLRIKVFFEAASGFLTSHLPMNNGSFPGTKEENKEKPAEKKNREEKRNLEADGKKGNESGSTFDMRG